MNRVFQRLENPTIILIYVKIKIAWKSWCSAARKTFLWPKLFFYKDFCLFLLFNLNWENNQQIIREVKKIVPHTNTCLDQVMIAEDDLA